MADIGPLPPKSAAIGGLRERIHASLRDIYPDVADADHEEAISLALMRMVREGYAVVNKDRIRLTSKGRFYAERQR